MKRKKKKKEKSTHQMNKNSKVVYLGNPAIPNPSNLFKIPTPQLRTESFHRQRNRKFNRTDSIFAEITTYARPQPMIEKMLKPKEDKSIDLGFLKTSTREEIRVIRERKKRYEYANRQPERKLDLVT